MERIVSKNDIVGEYYQKKSNRTDNRKEVSLIYPVRCKNTNCFYHFKDDLLMKGELTFWKEGSVNFGELFTISFNGGHKVQNLSLEEKGKGKKKEKITKMIYDYEQKDRYFICPNCSQENNITMAKVLRARIRIDEKIIETERKDGIRLLDPYKRTLAWKDYFKKQIIERIPRTLQLNILNYQHNNSFFEFRQLWEQYIIPDGDNFNKDLLYNEICNNIDVVNI